MTGKPYFDRQTQAEALPDDGLRTNRSWVEGVVSDRFYRASTIGERDTFSQKVLDRTINQRVAFLKSVVFGTAYRTSEINEYFQLVHNRVPTTQELNSALNSLKLGSKYQGLIAARFATSEFFNTNAPAFAGQPASPATFARAVYLQLFGAPGTPAQEADLASKAGSVASRKSAVLAILNGTQYRTKLINDTFNHFLGVAPTGPQLTAYLSFLQTKKWELLIVDMLGAGAAGVKPPNPDTVGIPRLFWEIVN
jgi:hypothetical protein